jgi:hypothetical protein
MNLRPEASVIGVVHDAEVRTYPLKLLRARGRHDTYDESLLVTYCSLCRSGLTAICRVNGERTRFGSRGCCTA